MTKLLQKTWNIGRQQDSCIAYNELNKNKETSSFYLTILYQRVWVFDSNICPNVYYVMSATWCKVKDDIVTFCIAQSVTKCDIVTFCIAQSVTE